MSTTGAVPRRASAWSNTSRGCAPSTSRRAPSRKAGTPLTPIDCACAVEAMTRSPYVAVDDPRCLQLVEPRLHRDRDDPVRVADVASVLPVGVHEAVVHRPVQIEVLN